MKSTYYVATTVNAYRRAIDAYLNNEQLPFNGIEELKKTSHRKFTTGFYFGSDEKTNNESSNTVQYSVFSALVKEDSKDGYVKVELRNKFQVGETLEVLSPRESFNQKIQITEIKDKNSEPVEVANRVQDIYYIKADISLYQNDILRK